jgi:hypothetical protein
MEASMTAIQTPSIQRNIRFAKNLAEQIASRTDGRNFEEYCKLAVDPGFTEGFTGDDLTDMLVPAMAYAAPFFEKSYYHDDDIKNIKTYRNTIAHANVAPRLSIDQRHELAKPFSRTCSMKSAAAYGGLLIMPHFLEDLTPEEVSGFVSKFSEPLVTDNNKDRQNHRAFALSQFLTHDAPTHPLRKIYREDIDAVRKHMMDASLVSPVVSAYTTETFTNTVFRKLVGTAPSKPNDFVCTLSADEKARKEKLLKDKAALMSQTLAEMDELSRELMGRESGLNLVKKPGSQPV